MKRYINIIGLLFSVLFWNACVDEDIVKKEQRVVEGIPTTVSLSFATQDANKIATRSAIDASEEYRVYDLTVFVFKQKGTEWVKEAMVRDFTTTSSKQSDGTGVTKGTSTLEITSGTKRIYAIANGVDNPFMPIANIETVTTIDELMALTAVMQQGSVERGQSHLLMSGMYTTEDNADGLVVINPEDNGKTLTSGKITLKHLDAKITFRVTTPDGITFTPKEWRVINVPIASNVFEKNYAAGSTMHDAVGYDEENDYFSSPTTNINRGEGISFTFYMPENRKNVIGDIVEDAREKGVDPYQLREKQEKNNPHTDAGGNKVVENGDYIYAAKYATYVEMTGSYHQDASEADVEKSAEVKYTIHLGYEGNDAANFRSRRACDYTYNVRITGVNAIEVEVETSDEDEPTEGQPGAEGDVVKSKTYLYVDAHYVTKSITFSQDLVSDDASFRVKTPYDLNGIGDDASDYKWVWFVQNEKIEDKTEGQRGYYEYSDFLRSRSGYDLSDKYDKNSGWRTFSSKASRPQSRTWHDEVPASNNGWKYKQGEENFVSFMNSIYENKTGIYSGTDYVGKRMNIKDLIKLLQAHRGEKATENSIYDSEGHAAFTVFIDEFYYEDDAASWATFVNVPNREMHILCDTRYSQDKESSMTTSNFLISQRSIKTFYDTNTKTAWGVETVREGERLGKGSISTTNASQTNGRWNMYNYMQYTSSASSKNQWSTYINSSTNKLKDDWNKVAYACLQRNRDLNGDGKITDNEVRWYLPAINQMVGMWIGRDGFSSAEVYLFNGNTATVENNTRHQYHFQNSNNVMFWAEEGAATGNNDDANPLDYRCVRNLGGYDQETPTKSNEPLDYVGDFDTNSRIFDLSRMNIKAIRTEFYKGELAVTDELNQANRPYKYFKVAKNLTNGTVSQKEVYDGESPCKDYTEETGDKDKGTWRMPNHRELMLITAYVDDESVTLSRTRSSLSKVKNSTYFGSVFYQQRKGIITLDEGQTYTYFKVRCVKDVANK